MNPLRLALVVLLIGTIGSSPPCLAKDKDSDSSPAATEASATTGATSTSTPTSPSTSAADSSSTLKGGVMSVAATAEKEVKEVEATCHHLLGSVNNVFCEVQRQDSVMVMSPDVIGTMVIPAIPDASGMMSMGILPPRKKWLDYFNYQVAQLIDILYKEANAVVLPEDASSQASADWTKIKDLVNQMVPVYNKMKSLSEGPKFDNMAIATQAQILHNTVKDIEKLRKSVYSELKQVDKTRKKTTK